jgi:hypothetical protein
VPARCLAAGCMLTQFEHKDDRTEIKYFDNSVPFEEINNDIAFAKANELIDGI